MVFIGWYVAATCISCTDVSPSYLSRRGTVTSLYLVSKKVEVHFSVHGFWPCVEPGVQCLRAAESRLHPRAARGGWCGVCASAWVPAVGEGRSCSAGAQHTSARVTLALVSQGCVWGLWAHLRVSPGAYLADSREHRNLVLRVLDVNL